MPDVVSSSSVYVARPRRRSLSSVLHSHLPVLIMMTGIAACFLWTGRLKRWHGVVLLTMDVTYWIISYVIYGGAPLED